MKRVVLVLLAFLCVENVLSIERYRYKWMTFDKPIFGSYSLNMNMTNGGNGWNFSMSQFRQDGFLTTYRDNVTMEELQPRLNSMALSRIWHKPLRLGYVSWGIGLAYARGSWARNCVGLPDGWWDVYCDSESISTVGVPFSFNVALGRYLGLGVSARILYTAEDRKFGMVSLQIPLGDFSRIR